jgi:PAS domain S-box-containing protein
MVMGKPGESGSGTEAVQMLDSNDRRAERPIPPALRAMLRASDGILDLLPIAAFICDACGTILQYNRHAVEIWRRAPRPGERHDQFTAGVRFYDINNKPLARSGLAEVLARGEPAREVEVIVERADGSRVTVALNIDPLRDAKGEIIGAVSCFLDISERKRVEAALETSRLIAREQEQRLAATYEHAAIGISEIAPDGSFLRVNEAICHITGYSRDELMSIWLFRHSHSEDVEPDRLAFQKQVAGELEFYAVEKRFVRKDGRVIWLSVSSSPVRDAEGQLLYLVRVVQDITERKAAEQRNRLLIDELNHRVKNTLATVQSLASQTARGVPTPAEFRERFEGRLIALSKAHDQLTRHHWESADLRELLSGSLAPYAGPERAVLRGEDVVLRPRAVLTLAMAFHELATNAAKYGALSAPGGRVEIRWQVTAQQGDERPWLHIDWLEQGGPPVAEPQQRGFGSKLIEGSIAAELHGRAALQFAPAGLRCEIFVPLETATLATDDRPGAGADWTI